MNPRAPRVGYALVAFAAMGWGTWPLILQHAPMPASLQAAVVMAVMTLASLPIVVFDRMRVRATPWQWAGVGWLGVADALNVGLFFGAYQRTSVAVAVLTHYLTPVIVAAAEPAVLGVRFRLRTGVAVAVALFGLVLLLEPWRAGLSVRDLVGAAFGAGSAIFYASNVLVNKRLAPAFSAAELMFFHGIIATPLLFAFAPFTAVGGVLPQSFAIVVAGALGPGAAGGLFFIWGLRRVPASHASVLALLEPFVAVVLAAVWLGQRVGGIPILGGVLILVAAASVIVGPSLAADRVASQP